MTFANPNPSGRLDSPGISVEVTDTPLPIGMRLGRLKLQAASGARPGRPRLPSFPAMAPIVPAVGVTALTMLLARDRRRQD